MTGEDTGPFHPLAINNEFKPREGGNGLSCWEEEEWDREEVLYLEIGFFLPAVPKKWRVTVVPGVAGGLGSSKWRPLVRFPPGGLLSDF